MESLQYAYGSKIWKNCILALTFSNNAWKRCGKISKQPGQLTQVEVYDEHINTYIIMFKKELKRLKSDVDDVDDVQLVHDFPLTPPPLDPNFERTILAIPAGDELEDEVLPEFKKKVIKINTNSEAGDEKITLNNWRDIFFYTAAFKCNSSTQESLLKYRLGPILFNIAKKGGFGGAGGAGAGAAAGAAVGAAVGAVMGPLTGPGLPFVIVAGTVAGAGVGALIGLGTGTAVSAKKLYS